MAKEKIIHRKEIEAAYWQWTGRSCSECSSIYEAGDKLIVSREEARGDANFCPCSGHEELTISMCIKCARQKGILW